MGLEAYSVSIDFIHPVSKNIVFNELIKLGYVVSEDSLNFIYLEKAYNFGYIEVALRNEENNNQDVKDVFIRIAKPNHENIIDYFIADLSAFNKNIPITIINLQSKEKVDLCDYSGLKEHFINTQREFKKYYPKPTYPIRCNDVFKSDG